MLPSLRTAALRAAARAPMQQRATMAAAAPATSALFGVQSRRSYHEKVLDHYNSPRNPGSLDRKDQAVGTGLVGAPACGDVMKLQIRVDNGTITDAKFKTFGCGSAIASSSYLTELVKGMRIEDAAKIRNTDIANNLHLPPVKLHCSMLAEDAIRAAIADYHTKNPPTNLGASEVKTLELEK